MIRLSGFESCGNPTILERAMETQRGVEGITGINSAGHRHAIEKITRLNDTVKL